MKLKSIFLMLLFASTVQYTQAILVRFPSLTGVAGDTLTVPLYVDDDLTGMGVISFQFDINYTSANVELLGAYSAGTLSAGFGQLVLNKQLNNFSIVGAGSTPLSGKGILLNLKFVISQSTGLSFNNTVANNFFNEGNPVMTFANGGINVNQKPVISVSPKTAELSIGETLQFYSSGGTSPYTWSVSDNSLATISSTGLLTALKSGVVEVIAKDAKGYEGKSENVECKSFVATFRDTTFYQNNYIEIPLNFKNLDATPMLAGKFVFTFSKTVLSFDSLIVANTILANKASVERSVNADKVTVTFASSSAITNSGTIFKLRFKIADIASGGSGLTIDEATINESIVPKWKNGYFSIKPLATLYISPASAEVFAGENKQFTVSGGVEPYTWEVENPILASTTNAGNLTALSGGTTNLIVKDVFGAKKSIPITIYDTWVNVRDSAAVLNKQLLTIPIDLGKLPAGKGILSAEGNIVSSYAKIDSIKLVSEGSLTQNWQLVTNKELDKTNFAMSGTTKINDGGELLYLNIYFKNTIAVGDAFTISCNNLILNEGNPNVKTKAGNISIKSIISGINDIQNNEITIYPNPVKSEFRVIGTENIKRLDVFDLTGKLVLSKALEGEKSVSIEHLQSGVYLIHLYNESTAFRTKLIKN